LRHEHITSVFIGYQFGFIGTMKDMLGQVQGKGGGVKRPIKGEG